MTSREKLLNALDHNEGPIPLDIGSTGVTGIHVRAVRNLRLHYGLEDHPVKVIEPYQMLGEVEDDLAEMLGIDVIGFGGKKNMFGILNENWRPMKTFWGQEVLVPGEFNTSHDKSGNLLIHPEGDLSVPPTAKMPKGSFFFDALNRQQPFDETDLDVHNNLEEFTLVSQEDLEHLKSEAEKASKSNKGVIATFGGTAFGDIALVPAMQLKDPKGIRDVSEWYMSTIMRQDYIHQIFEGQSEIALQNLQRIYEVVGEQIQAVFICGTDFGTQDSQFCDVDTFNSLYAPYYKKVNNWIHENTGWKTFKHSCGSVEPFMDAFIDAGFDIINPVQINAKDMVPEALKKNYGKHLVFWGGGVDTQIVLPFGKPGEVKEQVKHACDVFGTGGGFVFNTVHNIQANVPAENMVAMFDTFRQYSQ
ncbi:MAG: methyltransferase [Bacteroidales bacterium]|nr:methyltransferase [Bacteroidales bacterium]